jgi:UDP-apiose/xylose synthase
MHLSKNYLILGCSGYIGSHLVNRLLEREDVTIYGWDLADEKISDKLDHPRFHFYQEDISDALDKPYFMEAFEKADAVIQLAAICNPSMYNTDPLAVIRSSFSEPCPVVDLCSKHNKWLIHFSTSEIYGRTLSSYCGDDEYENLDLYELREDETPLIMGPITNQRWSYACAKQLMERYIFAHNQMHDMPFTIVRPLNFFGPRMDYLPGHDGQGIPRVLACFMGALIDKEPMLLVDKGTARRTITSIDDAIDAVELILAKPESSQNEIFNIGHRGNEVNMRELAVLMRNIYADITGDQTYRDHPIEEVTGEAFYGEGYEDCDRRLPTTDKAKEKLGWVPKILLEEIMRVTMQSYHDAYSADINAVKAG